MRRFSALGLAAFMLHLNVVRADVACADHDAAIGGDAPAQNDMAATHTGHGADPSESAPEEADCQTPSQSDCCQAVTSCSPAIAVSTGTQIAEAIPAHDATGAQTFMGPLTRSAAPEPPPPRL